MMPNDPPDFDTVCRLLFVFHLGGKQYPCDMKIIDDYIESPDMPEATRNALLRKRGAAVSAFIAGDDDTLGERLEDLAGACYLLRKQDRDRPNTACGKKFKIEQRRKAGLDRGRIDTDNDRTSITAILKTLAFKTDTLGDYLRSNEVWPELFDKLGQLGLEPGEAVIDNVAAYTFDGGAINYNVFKALLSDIRNGKR